MSSYFDIVSYEELLNEIKYVYRSDDRPWIIGYSGGKDSTTVVELVYEMLKSLAPQHRHKNVYIISSDTLIENPLIKIYLNKMNNLLGEAAAKDRLPIKSCMVTPKFNNTFWTNIIGKGFPTPRMNGTFRWCTDRLKIKPSADKIKAIMAEEDKEVIVLLGVRKAESIARKRRIEGRELTTRMLNRHETIPNAYVYNPIVELTTEDVWTVLLEHNSGKPRGDQIIVNLLPYILMLIAANVRLQECRIQDKHRVVVSQDLAVGVALLLKRTNHSMGLLKQDTAS